MTPEQNKELLTRLHSLSRAQSRSLIAIAGAPGSGKSTLAQSLAAEIGPAAAIVPMDGFHHSNAELKQMGLLHRKGAPETFDLAGFHALIQQLLQGGVIKIPHFDRARDSVVLNAATITDDTRVVLVEGNYLLLDEPDWAALDTYWTYRIWIDVPDLILSDRLIRRWLGQGLNISAAKERALENDLPNAWRTQANRLAADIVLS